MALGRNRNKPRSSSGSYTSTVTTIVFIALCVLGVWMLTSDSIVSPQTTTRTSTSTSTKGPDEPNDIVKQAGSKPFEDNPGDLPEDAIKNGEPQKQVDDRKSEITNKDYSKDSNVGASYQQPTEGKSEMQETTGKNVDGDAKGNKNEAKVNHNAQGLDGKEAIGEVQNQNEQQTQIIEESTLPTKEDIHANIKEEKTNLHLPKNEPGNDEEAKPQDQSEEKKEDEQIQQNLNDTSNEERKQNDDSQQAKEEQQQDLEQQTQQQDDKAITFTDETKKESLKEETKDDLNTKPTKEKTKEQTTSQQPDAEATKEQGEHQKDSDPTNSVNKPDTTTSADEKPVETTVLPNTGIPKESTESKRSWHTQAAKSKDEKQRQKDKLQGQDKESLYGYTWQLCNTTASFDYIPCLDNEKALKKLRTTKHFEHRERHCPEDPPTCLVPVPPGYKKPIIWPQSRDKIWFHNVPHTELAEVKGHQNWVKVTGEFLTFPGGGTQFIHGALHYIDCIEKAVPGIKWGKHTRVVLDVGCGVASFGGYLFERDVLTMSFAPKDEHEAQVQFALERGIPAISAVMGTQRLPFPSGVFDVVHCARCRVPWHEEGGRLLLELNRVLRPGGYFIWSATPVYQKLQEDVEIWDAMSSLTARMCWKLEKTYKDTLNKVGAAIYRKPINNGCYDKRPENIPPMCKSDDDPNAAWYVPLQSCMHRIPIDESVRGSKWPLRWPKRLRTAPYWLNKTQLGIYGKPAPDDFERDYEHWQRVVNRSYLHGLGISWSNVRNVMDMRAVYGGFAAALKDLKIWVMNVVNVNAPDTLPIIYERGLFGIYHDWCESFSTYPRTYDLLHADHLFSKLKERCKLAPVMAEIDRIVRPGGNLIVRDESAAIGEIENLLKSLHWEVHLTFSKDREGILSATKTDWRPTTYDAIS